MSLTLLFAVILVALVFEYINGFHDTANSIATVVATKVLTPTQAVMMAAIMNLIGALWGTAVAKTISSGLIDSKLVTMTSDILICALLGGIVWNLVTWWLGLPSSSSHALIGGLCGAALAAAGNNWHVIIWSQPAADHWYKGKGLLWKVVVPMFSSPLGGFLLGFLLMGLLYALIAFLNHRTGWVRDISRPRWVNWFFGKAQIFSASAMGFMHGTNDAQKTMGIIALALVSATTAGALDSLPSGLSFLHTKPPPPGKDLEIATWIKITCAIVMALGTAAGGWRIIKTLGHKMVKLHPINGFAAETSSATMIGLASSLGIPVSTTHNISAAIMGVGCARRLNAIRWTVVERMVWAWLLTIPVSGLIAYLLTRLVKGTGGSS
jgi:PiT family inorganic phosphate transporter